MQKTLENNLKRMQDVNKRTSNFANFFNNFMERNTPIVSQYIKRFCDSNGINLGASKKKLKVKNVTKKEKMENWNVYKMSVVKACLVTLIAKGFLNLIWFIKDTLMLKYDSKFREFQQSENSENGRKKSVEELKAEEAVASGTIEAGKSFIDEVIEAIISSSLDNLTSIIENSKDYFLVKLSKVMSVDDILQMYDSSLDNLLSKMSKTRRDIEPSHILINLKIHSDLSSENKFFKLLHKNQFQKFRWSRVFTGFYNSLKTKKKINCQLKRTMISDSLILFYKNYRFKPQSDEITAHLMHTIKKRVITNNLSVINEEEEKKEETSEFIDEESGSNKIIIYEESSTHNWGDRNLETERKLVNNLTQTMVEYFDEFLDLLSSPNSQIILEYYIQFQFKKMSNRLVLLSQKLKKDMPYIKYISYMNNILEEEFFNHQFYTHDNDLYESRSKQLFSYLEQNIEDDVEPQAEEVEDEAEGSEIEQNEVKFSAEDAEIIDFDIDVAKEAKMSKYLIDSMREMGGRIYFNTEYETYFGKDEQSRASFVPQGMAGGDGVQGNMNDLASLMQMLG